MAVLQGFGYYVSSDRTRAFGCYKADGCRKGVAVKRGSTVYNNLEDAATLYVHVPSSISSKSMILTL